MGEIFALIYNMEIKEKIILPQLVDTYYLGIEDMASGFSRTTHQDITEWMIQEVVAVLNCSVSKASKVVADTMLEMKCWE